MDLTKLAVPIVQAPLAGGASTPELAAAVNAAGGLGFLAAGYKTTGAVREDIRKLRSLSEAPFGVNIFAPPAPVRDAAAIAAYADSLRRDAERHGTTLGDPRHDDDYFDAKVELACNEHVPVVSFTFGCPEPAVVRRLHEAGCDAWVTVTNPDEALLAQSVGADALVVQGFEAGGHRAYFTDSPDTEELGLLAALQLVRNRVGLPLVAAGAIADGTAVAAVLCAGAAAAQIGSALMLAPEAGTSEPHRAALAEEGSTRLTRAFSGRQARGIVNRFMREHDADAPAAYPDVHYLTTPIRNAARQAGDPERLNLWAGQAHALAVPAPAAEIVRGLGAEARDAAKSLALRLERAG
ncbi:MAG TPA: nitronate monooxygenase [Solirubrobacteraceae bacterium]|nr:nitronate monooxygenase [Solirubrobacteraceae bacterium]